MGCLTQFFEVFLGPQAAGFSYKERFLLHFCALSNSYKQYMRNTVRGDHVYECFNGQDAVILRSLGCGHM